MGSFMSGVCIFYEWCTYKEPFRTDYRERSGVPRSSMVTWMKNMLEFSSI